MSGRTFPAQQAERCGNCRYWRRLPGDRREPDGECRRYPPHLDSAYYYRGNADGIVESSTWWNFPLADEEEWCGEHVFSTPPVGVAT